MKWVILDIQFSEKGFRFFLIDIIKEFYMEQGYYDMVDESIAEDESRKLTEFIIKDLKSERLKRSKK